MQSGPRRFRIEAGGGSGPSATIRPLNPVVMSEAHRDGASVLEQESERDGILRSDESIRTQGDPARPGLCDTKLCAAFTREDDGR